MHSIHNSSDKPERGKRIGRRSAAYRAHKKQRNKAAKRIQGNQKFLDDHADKEKK